MSEDWPRYINDIDEDVMIINYDPLALRCKICDIEWEPFYREDGSLPPESWTCPNGCIASSMLLVPTLIIFPEGKIVTFPCMASASNWKR